MDKVFIIAEAGINHNGKIKLINTSNNFLMPSRPIKTHPRHYSP